MNRFDIVLGHFVFYSQHHGGQGSEFYERRSRVTRYFQPGAAFSESRFFNTSVTEYEDARAVYQALCQKHGFPNPFTVLIAIDRDETYAPGCFILCRVLNPEAGNGRYDWDTRDEENTVLVQTDFDFPSVARAFGWAEDESDIQAAANFLDTCVEEGRVAEDPGYFDTNSD